MAETPVRASQSPLESPGGTYQTWFLWDERLKEVQIDPAGSATGRRRD